MRVGFMRKDQIEAAIVKTTRMLASKGIKVTQRGHQAFCAFDKKGNVTLINLPVLPDEPTQEFMDALQGYLDHEVAHAIYTNSLQAEDVIAHSSLNVSARAKASLHQFANVVEDVRIETEIPKKFPGAEANLNKLRGHIIETVWRPMFVKLLAKSALDKSAAAELLGTALIPYMRGLGGQRICAEFIADMGLEPLFGPLNAAIPDLKQRIADMKDSGDAVRLAELIMKVNAPPPQAEQDDADADEGDDGAPQQKPDPKDEDEGQGASAEQEGDDDQPGDKPDDQSDEKGGSGGEEQDDTDKKGEGTGDPDPEDDDAGEGDDGDGSGSKEDTAEPDDEGDPQGGDDDADSDEGEDKSDDKGDQDSDGDDEDEDEDGSGGGKRNMSLQQAMRRIDPLQRRALFKYNNRRKTVDEIASELNCDAATVTDLMMNGRRNLARLMRGGK